MKPGLTGQAQPALSVLIPTLNEAGTLPALLQDLKGQQGLRAEWLVADGGSSDATVPLARRAGARVIATAPGRALQLNAAAAAARAPWLLCLHADSRLTQPDQLRLALDTLRTAHRAGGLVAGHWRLRFQRQQRGFEALFRQLEAKSASGRPGTVNGDQGLMIHARTLAALGGFDASLPFFEDQRLAARLFARGHWVTLPGVLETSARRFEVEGHRARLALMALIVAAEHAGLEDWLRALPALYHAQHQATRLSVAPFLASLWRYIERLPPPRRRVAWRSIAALLAANAWQLALWADTLTAAEGRWLRRFDRWLSPHMQHLAARLRPP